MEGPKNRTVFRLPTNCKRPYKTGRNSEQVATHFARHLLSFLRHSQWLSKPDLAKLYAMLLSPLGHVRSWAGKVWSVPISYSRRFPSGGVPETPMRIQDVQYFFELGARPCCALALLIMHTRSWFWTYLEAARRDGNRKQRVGSLHPVISSAFEAMII